MVAPPGGTEVPFGLGKRYRKANLFSPLCTKILMTSTRSHFLLLSASVFAFYLVYGYFQEWFFRQEGMKPHGWYLTLVQFALYSALARADMWRRGDDAGGRRIPARSYAVLSVTTLTTMGFSNASLGYLNYPTQVIFKCCKLIPVLAGGILIQGKKYGPVDFAAAAVMCVGLAAFTLADSKVRIWGKTGHSNEAK